MLEYPTHSAVLNLNGFAGFGNLAWFPEGEALAALLFQKTPGKPLKTDKLSSAGLAQADLGLSRSFCRS